MCYSSPPQEILSTIYSKFWNRLDRGGWHRQFTMWSCNCLGGALPWSYIYDCNLLWTLVFMAPIRFVLPSNVCFRWVFVSVRRWISVFMYHTGERQTPGLADDAGGAPDPQLPLHWSPRPSMAALDLTMGLLIILFYLSLLYRPPSPVIFLCDVLTSISRS